MDRVQKSRLRMYLAVQKVCEKYQNELFVIPAAKTSFMKFAKLVEKLQDASELQEKDFKGYAVDKNRSRDKMIMKAYAISSALAFYATNTENDILLEVINYTLADLKKAADTRVKEIADIILEAALKYETDLQPYGIDINKVDDLDDAIDVYAEKLLTPRTAIIARKNATSQIKRFMYEASYVLKQQLDKVLVQFYGSDFYMEYTSARMIIQPGVISPNGEVTDSTEASDDPDPVILQ